MYRLEQVTDSLAVALEGDPCLVGQRLVGWLKARFRVRLRLAKLWIVVAGRSSRQPATLERIVSLAASIRR